MAARTGSYSRYPAPQRRRRSSRKPALIALALILLLVGGALLAVRIEWPDASVTAADRALASVSTAPLGESVGGVTVLDPRGHRVAVDAPRRRALAEGEARGRCAPQDPRHRQARRVDLVARRRHEASRDDARDAARGCAGDAPAPAEGAPVVLRFRGTGATHLNLKLPGFGEQELVFEKPRARFDTGLHATGANRFGTLTVAAAARPWETLSPPARISWFPPPGARLEALVKPAPATVIEPSTPIELTFSQPVSEVLGRTTPSLDPPVRGVWKRTALNVLTFQPAAAGWPLGRHVTLQLPTRTDILAPGGKAETVSNLSWSVPVGSTLRLNQILSQLGYLPLSWVPKNGPVPPRRSRRSGGAPRARRHVRLALPRHAEAAAGPLPAESLDADDPGRRDGVPGRPQPRRRRHPRAGHLAHADQGGDQPATSADSYSYVLVHRSVPQTLDALEQRPGRSCTARDEHRRARPRRRRSGRTRCSSTSPSGR